VETAANFSTGVLLTLVHVGLAQATTDTKFPSVVVTKIACPPLPTIPLIVLGWFDVADVSATAGPVIPVVPTVYTIAKFLPWFFPVRPMKAGEDVDPITSMSVSCP